MSLFDTDASVAAVSAFFDEFAAGEWDRLVKDPAGLVSVELHRRMLARHIQPGHRVLEVGPGPGRFTLDLARLGASVTALDISPVQLGLHEQTMREAGLERHVADRVVGDVRDVSRWEPGEFDAVVAFGGPLSYVFDDAESTLAGLLRPVGPDGIVLASVMSLLGAWRLYALAEMTAGPDVAARMRVLRAVYDTGDLRHLPGHAHVCRLFRADEIIHIVHSHSGDLVDISATGWAVHCDPQVLQPIIADHILWSEFLDLEERSAAAPGALDGSNHILFAARPRRT